MFWLSVKNLAFCHLAIISSGFFLGVWVKMPREWSLNKNCFMVTWLGSYVYWHILHPHLKNYIKELSFTFNFLHLHQLFGINWRALSQCACWNCLVHIINSETILDMPVLSERWIMKCAIPTLLYSCSPKKVPLYGQAYPYRPCIGSNTYVRRRRESSYSLTVSAYFERFNQFSREQNY